MAFTYTGSTTFAEAVDAEQNTFALTTTTGVAVGSILVTGVELMHVRDIPVAGRVVVRRGVEGTPVGPHNSGETVFFGLPSDFAQIKDNALKLFGARFKLPDICIPGARGTDVRGYEYILVDSTATIVPGATVLISKDGNFTCSILTSSGAGNVGILMENATSNQWAWAMIRGRYTGAKLSLGSSLMTSTGVLTATTLVSTPSVGLSGGSTSQIATTVIGINGPIIHRMWPASAATTATTAATSSTGLSCDVWMEYPYVNRRLTS
jgi:hypothetical protein